MAVKVFIKRVISVDKAKEMIPLFREMRKLANSRAGYISGETMRNLDNPEEFMVISSWESSQDWKDWLESDERKATQAKIDTLLGGNTEYSIFHYGFKE